MSPKEKLFIKSFFYWLVIASTFFLAMIFFLGSSEARKFLPFVIDSAIVGWFLYFMAAHRIWRKENYLSDEKKKDLGKRRFIYELFSKREETLNKYEKECRERSREFFYELLNVWLTALLLIALAMAVSLGDWVKGVIFFLQFFIASSIIGYVGALAASPFYNCSTAKRIIATCGIVIFVVNAVMYYLLNILN